MVAPGPRRRHRLHRVEERRRRRPEQHRLRRGQGRPGPPGPAAGRRAGRHGIRVNGVNPDGVVRGSGIFAGGLGRGAGQGLRRAPRRTSASSTPGARCSRREVLPEHVAAAVFALVGGDLPLTTGTIVPVDGGVPRRSCDERGAPRSIDTGAHRRARTSCAGVARGATSRTPLDVRRPHRHRRRGASSPRSRAFSVAAPSWAVGTGGTRFGRFPIGGEPRDDRGEGRRRRRAQRADRRQPHDQPARAVGRPGDDAGGAARPTPRRWASAFDAMNSNTFQDNPSTTGDGARLLQVRQPGQRRRRRAQGGHRAQPRRHRPRREARLEGASPCGWPTA